MDALHHADGLSVRSAMDGGLLRAAVVSEHGCEVSPFVVRVKLNSTLRVVDSRWFGVRFECDGFVSSSCDVGVMLVRLRRLCTRV